MMELFRTNSGFGRKISIEQINAHETIIDKRFISNSIHPASVQHGPGIIQKISANQRHIC